MQQELDRVDKEIEHRSQALSLSRDGDPNLPLLLAHLGSSHNIRFNLRGEPDDVQKSIEYLSLALTLTPDNDPGLPDLLSALGVAHGKCYQRLGDMCDMEKSIEYMSRAVALTPTSHPDLPRQLVNLGVNHKERFERLGELDDIEKAIVYDSRAVALAPSGHPDLPELFEKLGTSYICRFQCLGGLDDLKWAVEYQTRGLALIPDGHPSLPIMLCNAAYSHRIRFWRLGDLSDLENAIEYESRALALTPEGHPDLPIRLSNLGVSLTHRFKRLGDLNILKVAIEYQTRALVLTPDRHPGLSDQLANLGTSHSLRFQRLGDLSDVEMAVAYQTRALALTPDRHPSIPSRLDNLGTSHNLRFQRLGDLSDIEMALTYQSRALPLTPDGHPKLSSRLANLGASHCYRFRQLGELENLEKAIYYQTRALDLTPHGHPDLSMWFANLGAYHSYQFGRVGDPHDLEKATEYHSRAVDSTPDDHPDLPSWLANLGATHNYRHRHLGELADIEKAIEYQSRALALTSDDHPQCIEAYQTTIDLLPQFVWLGATTIQRYDDLRVAKTLAVDAAHTAILSSHFDMALEWLEHAQCVVWNQNLMLRSPLDLLQMCYPFLATRLQTVATQLHRVSSESRESHALYSGSMTPEQVAQEHRRLAKEYDEMLTQARALPGFEDFLRPIKLHKLIQAAKYGPIVVINCHEDRCDVLLIIPEQNNVTHIPLTNFTTKKAQHVRSQIDSSLRRQGLRERGVHIRREPGHDEFGSALATLWVDIVKPVFEALGYTVCTNSRQQNFSVHNSWQAHDTTKDLPHITWCPTGAASFLPLHAAGDYGFPNSRAYNYAVASYTPTLTALLATTPSTLSRSSQLLAIGQEVTPGHRPLPGTTKELACMKSHVENKIRYSQLLNAQATPGTVLDAMEKHDWVHLACHAHQNVYDPTKSGFFLHGGTLDLAVINQRSFKKKGLAFLSACQTAAGDETLPDEAVHLASGMLMAGYSSVIATMWSVVDEDAPFAADKVYSQLMQEGKLGNGEAGKALHNAVAGLRGRVGEKEFGRWVPYIHIGS
ncbi:aromatic di-alanine and TPR containing protein [Rhizoctonia solani AG-3 Rhs1AP]|uniref:Aromatic di-alanine and TPR containing protein n=2 Tax=Rhizoctonia solani AG-3 TaxID=1086053 RepID=A0A074RJH0_9AGAM|nr:aromatic di-alanine and TPR containing protein [Rhizoctonia solani AG-3 Rhs1AP]KEP45525.1 aromatic di-alanine and TPR containing protein [Rhizoctonia solani 123E]